MITPGGTPRLPPRTIYDWLVLYVVLRAPVVGARTMEENPVFVVVLSLLAHFPVILPVLLCGHKTGCITKCVSMGKNNANGSIPVQTGNRTNELWYTIPTRRGKRQRALYTNRQKRSSPTHACMSKWWVKDDTTDAKMTEGDGPRGG